MESVAADFCRWGKLFATKSSGCILKYTYPVGHIQETTADGSDKQFMHCCVLHRNRVLELIYILHCSSVGIFSRYLTIAAGPFEDGVPRG